MKYRRFYYDAGYVGTEVEEYYSFEDNVSETEIQKFYKEWLFDQFEHSCTEVELSEIPEYAEVIDN